MTLSTVNAFLVKWDQLYEIVSAILLTIILCSYIQQLVTGNNHNTVFQYCQSYTPNPGCMVSYSYICTCIHTFTHTQLFFCAQALNIRTGDGSMLFIWMASSTYIVHAYTLNQMCNYISLHQNIGFDDHFIASITCESSINVWVIYQVIIFTYTPSLVHYYRNHVMTTSVCDNNASCQLQFVTTSLCDLSQIEVVMK